MDPRTALALITLIDHVALAIRLGPKVKANYDALSARVRSMVDNDREPTDAEWEDFGRRASEGSNRLRAAAALLDE